MIVERLAAYAASWEMVDLPDEARRAATRAIVDWFAVAVVGSAMAPAAIVRAAMVGDSEAGWCQLAGDGRAVGPATAALVNGTAAHCAELDDIYREGLYHPGAPTVAAALAAAQHAGASGRALLRAVVIGYEIGDRVAEAMGPAHYRYWHPTGTVGTLGAAAAAAAAIGLEEAQTAHALATAVTLAAGLQQAFRGDAMSKPLHAGHAAQAGVMAALCAKAGATGATEMLEGPVGFGAAMGVGPDWGQAVAGLGDDRPRIMSTTVKVHAACGHAAAAIDAVLELRSAGAGTDGIARIVVETYGTAIAVAGNPDPATPFEAKFSIPYCVAAALARGSVWLQAFTEEAIRDDDVRRLTRQVELVEDPALDDRFPTSRSARVTLVTDDGRERTVTRYTRKGDPDDPVSEGELREKFSELVGPVTGTAVANRLSSRLWHLVSADSVRGLVPQAS